MSEQYSVQETWHLDKRVPISIIFAIFLQTAGIFWYGGVMDQKVTNIELRLDALDARTTADRNRLATQSQDIAVLTEQVKSTTQSLDRLRTEIALTNQLLRQAVSSASER